MTWTPPPRTYGRTTCIIDGCDGAHRAKGLCNMHLLRWYNHGDPLTNLADEDAEPVEVTCEWCSATFTQYASTRQLRPQRHCSMRCRLASEDDRRATTLAKRGRSCRSCGDIFTIRASYLSRSDAGKFCSRDCWRDYMRAKSIVTLECMLCGRSFERKRGGKTTGRVYCSRECADSARVRVGSQKGRGSGWRRRAEEIRTRDLHRCVRCGADETTARHAVDHIVPWVLVSSDPIRANHGDNLATLCTSCHGVKTTKIEPRLLRGDWLALSEFYGDERAARARARVADAYPPQPEDGLASVLAPPKETTP